MILRPVNDRSSASIAAASSRVTRFKRSSRVIDSVVAPARLDDPAGRIRPGWRVQLNFVRPQASQNARKVPDFADIDAREHHLNPEKTGVLLVEKPLSP